MTLSMAAQVCSPFCGDQSCPRSSMGLLRRKFSLATWRSISVSSRGGSATGFDFALSFMLLGIGHLVGLGVGLAMLLGALIGWGWGVPHFSGLSGDITTDAAALAQNTWSTKVRFIGAGAIGVSAIWTLLKLGKPVARGLTSAMAASRARKAGQADALPITERDIPIGIVGLISFLCLIPIGFLLWNFAQRQRIG